MKIGYACIPIGIPQKTTRSFVLKNFSREKFSESLSLNLKDLKTILEYNLKNNIYMFRISSDIIPFGSHEVNNIDWWNIYKDELQDIGNFIKNNNIRVSMHPGQYTVLNSPSEDIVIKALKDLEYHCTFLDSLGVDYRNKIVLHVGGVYGDKASAIERFKINFKRLSDSAKKRLVLENDEKSFTIEDVLNICNSIHIPAVFDNLHHKCNPSLGKNLYNTDKNDTLFKKEYVSKSNNSTEFYSESSVSSTYNILIKDDLEDILREVKKTWKTEDGDMKLHYSDSDANKNIGAHSKFILTENFLDYYSVVNSFNADVMLEVKDKNLSAIKCVHCLQDIEANSIKSNKENTSINENNISKIEKTSIKPLKKSTIFDQWAKYKYSVMEKNYSYYKECSKIVNSDKDIVAFYKYVDFALLIPFSPKNFKNTIQHTWGYFKDIAKEKEKSDFESLVKDMEDINSIENIDYANFERAKKFIERLSKKYKCEYLLNSYYFIY